MKKDPWRWTESVSRSTGVIVKALRPISFPRPGREGILKKGVGEPVNIETDLIGKYVEKFFSGATGLTEEGFSH